MPSIFGKEFMATFSMTRIVWVLFAVAVGSARVASAQGNFAAQGGEFSITGSLPGQQVYPQLSVSPSGGYLVWQDNVTDGSGLGISARRLDSSLSGNFGVFRVNETGANDQERPSLAMLTGGGALFVWAGGPQSFQHIYGRVLTSAGTWVGGDFMVSGATNAYQLEASTAALTNGNAVVVWSSFNQVGSSSMRDVYLQVLTSTGGKFGVERLVNQATTFNQRSAAIAPLNDGRFIVVWISEQQRFENSVDVFGRIFTSAGSAVGNEFLINSGTNVCSNPTVAPSLDGGFVVAWSENHLPNLTNGWDIVARPFSANAMGGIQRKVNTFLLGNQLAPKIAAMGNNYLVVWTSVGQDLSGEGVYGQFLNGDGSLSGSEFRVNTTTVSQQMYPAVASDGVTRFQTVWGAYVGGGGSFDLYAQRYINTNAPLAPPSSPVVVALNSSSLGVSWPPVQGLSISNYEVYADGAATPTVSLTNSYWLASGLSPASTHSYRIAYMLADGRRSPLSGSATNTTYGTILYSGIPVEWMAGYFGESWPSASADSDGDGDSNREEFLRGTDPTDANSVLRPSLRNTSQGVFLDWRTVPGLMYQVQLSTLNGAWTDVGGPRFAAGTNDSIYVGGASAGFYRVGRLR
jgi:hypothetical protein